MSESQKGTDGILRLGGFEEVYRGVRDVYRGMAREGEEIIIDGAETWVTIPSLAYKKERMLALGKDHSMCDGGCLERSLCGGPQPGEESLQGEGQAPGSHSSPSPSLLPVGQTLA